MISPVPPLLPKKQTKAGGVASYALGLLILLAVVAIAEIPLAIGLLEHVFNRTFSIDPSAIASIVLIMLVLPLAAGMALHALLPRVALSLQDPVRWLSTGVLVLAALALLAGSWPAVWSAIGDGTVVALAGSLRCTSRWWLPTVRTTTNPPRSSARTTSVALSDGSRVMRRRRRR